MKTTLGTAGYSIGACSPEVDWLRTPSFVVSDRRQHWPAVRGIAGGVYGGVRDALQVLVHPDTSRPIVDATPFQIEIVDLGHTAGAVYYMSASNLCVP